MDSFFDDYEQPEPISLWRANHGNWLLGLVAAIGLLGSLIMMFSTPVAIRTGSDVYRAAEVLRDQIKSDATSSDGTLLTITVSGTKNDEGQMMLAIYDTANQFNDPTLAVLKSSRPIENGAAKWIIAAENLPDEFAVAAYHDQNIDGILNLSMFGIPAESYGFSNQASGNFGPPSFEQAVLARPTEDESVEIHLGSAIPIESR